MYFSLVYSHDAPDHKNTHTLVAPSPEVWGGASVGAGFGDVSSSLSISLLGKVTANVTLLCYMPVQKARLQKTHSVAQAGPWSCWQITTQHFYYDKCLNVMTDASTSYISCTCNVCTHMLFLLISIICPYVNVYVLWSVFQQGVICISVSTQDLIIHFSKSHSYSKALYLHLFTLCYKCCQNI